MARERRFAWVLMSPMRGGTHRRSASRSRLLASQHLVAVVVAAAAFLIAGCASVDTARSAGAGATLPAEAYHPHVLALTADLTPVGGVPRFFGASPRLGDRSKELSVALEAAAKQASRFLGLKGKLYLYQNSSSAGAFVEQQVEANYDEKAVTAKDLTLLTSYRDQSGTFVVASLPTADMPSANWYPALSPRGDERPAWIDSPPRLPGYLTAVGVAQRRRWISESIAAADYSALGELIRQLSVRIQSGAGERHVEGIGSSTSSAAFERAAADIRGFYVLARWATPSGESWFSLAVAPRAGSVGKCPEPLGGRHDR